jgi:hypothetical protein
MTPWMPAGMVAEVMHLEDDGAGSSGAGAAPGAPAPHDAQPPPPPPPPPRRRSSGEGGGGAGAVMRAGSMPASAFQIDPHQQPPPPPPRSASMSAGTAAAAAAVAAALAAGTPAAATAAPQLQPLSLGGAGSGALSGALSGSVGSPMAGGGGGCSSAGGQDDVAATLFLGGCEPGKEPLWRFIDAAGTVQVCGARSLFLGPCAAATTGNLPLHAHSACLTPAATLPSLHPPPGPLQLPPDGRRRRVGAAHGGHPGLRRRPLARRGEGRWRNGLCCPCAGRPKTLGRGHELQRTLQAAVRTQSCPDASRGGIPHLAPPLHAAPPDPAGQGPV